MIIIWVLVAIHYISIKYPLIFTYNRMDDMEYTYPFTYIIEYMSTYMAYLSLPTVNLSRMDGYE